MNLSELDNFLFVPRSGESSDGDLYELCAADRYSENSVVLIPYAHPGIKKPQPQFFRILNTAHLSFPTHVQVESGEPLQLKAGTTKQDYIARVKALKQHIQRGDIYEINYCIRFTAENCVLDPLSVFQKLHRLAQAPYAMLLKQGDDFIISASPELFLKKEGTRISTKPIKGTIRRGKDAEEDLQLKNELHHNLKERTENVMAVDVARNDLSMFAKKGSVTVNKLYNIETFETVHQMVSTVSCEIREPSSFETIIACTFPMASMTGAPKLRAMDLIHQYEDFERGTYSGAMGIIDTNGDYTLAVLIRSIFYNQKTLQLSVCAGGAITYLSDPEKEYDECLLKLKALLAALNASLT